MREVVALAVEYQDFVVIVDLLGEPVFRKLTLYNRMGRADVYACRQEAQPDSDPVMMAVHRQSTAMQAAERQHGGTDFRADPGRRSSHARASITDKTSRK